MVVLSDHTIKQEIDAGRIVIEPLGDGCIQPASVDLRLDKKLLRFIPDRYSFIDVRKPLDDLTEEFQIVDPAVPYLLQPNEFLLASTLEYIELPADIVARLEGKSSLGRLGLLVHATAGYIDPGFKGQITLEITNVANVPITLYDGMKISQISYLRMSTPAEFPYGSAKLGSKYQGQTGPTATQIHKNFTDPHHDSRQSGPRPYPDQPTKLREWLESSPYQGDITRFARVVEVPVKTVEDWVYGRYTPNAVNSAKIYEVTGLSQYASNQEGQQQSLDLDENPEPAL